MQDTSSTTTGRGYYRSSSFKMAVFFTVLLGMSVSILVYFGYYFSRASYVSVTQGVLASDILHMKAWDTNGDLQKGLTIYDDASRAYLLKDKDGVRVAGTLTKMPDTVEVLEEGTILFKSPDAKKTYAARIHTFPDGRLLLLGIDVTQSSKNYQRMTWLAGLSIVFLLLVILTSFAISTFVVGRTGKIAATASSIMDTGDLSQRIELDSRWDDIGYMAATLNRLLGRIEELMAGVKQVSDSIAHDLRTPLSRLRSHLEALQAHPKITDDADIKNTCERLIQECDQILSTFAALLRIAKIEAGQEKSQFTSVSIDTIIKDVLELYEPLAEDKKIKLEINLMPYTRPADRDLLFQLFANLLDNAIKFTPDGGVIRLELDARRFRMADTGPGVDASEQTRIFERFYRAEKSRTKPGTGLGLSLVAAVAKLHNIRIETGNLNPGFGVTLHL